MLVMIRNTVLGHYAAHIQKHIEDRLSEELLKGTVLTGGKVLVDVVDGEFVVKTGMTLNNEIAEKEEVLEK